MIARGSTSSNFLNQRIGETNQENVLCCRKQEMPDELQLCKHEEADYRLLLHAYDTSRKRFRKLSIITVNTEAVAIALYHFFISF